MGISFNVLQPIVLPKRTKLRLFIGTIFHKENKTLGTLALIFCSDSYLLKINQDFLHHDYFTDIITFDLSESGANCISGEIYISVDTVRVNARRFETTILSEIHRVMFHGVLHLCGYRDKTKSQQALMRQKEDEYLAMYFE